MAQHPILEISGTMVSGGWYFECETHLFYYFMKRLNVSQDILLLDHYIDPLKWCPTYSIDCIINDKNINNINLYIDDIFGTKFGGAPDIFTIKKIFFCIVIVLV